jgi:signal transduction histidine kinase/ActR/RegA family two-component response regulator
MARLSPLSYRAKLVVLFAALLAVLFGALGRWLPERLALRVREVIEVNALEVATLTARSLEPALDFDDAESAAAQLAILARAKGAVYATLLRGDGTTLASFGAGRTPPPPAAGSGDGVVLSGGALHARVRVATRAGHAGALLAGFSSDRIDQGRAEVRNAVVLACAVVLAAGVAATLLLSGLLVRPLSDIVAVARRVAAGDPDAARELPLARRDEVGAVGRALAAMLERLHAQRAEMEALNGDLERRVADRTTALEAVNRELGARIEELRRTQEQLIVADRRVSIGRLAAGVAHEINNPLAFIEANLRFAAEELPEVALLAKASADPALVARVTEIAEALAESRQGADRVGHIVRGLKTFGRTDEDRREPVSVRAALEAALDMSAHEIKHRARVVRALGEAPLVDGNEVRLSQVFLNLLLNAAQALPEHAPAANEVRVSLYRDARGWAVAEVTDTGPGIPPEILDRIFDPFFTTKPVGVGTGLGLSISQGIVLSLGGELKVDTAAGRGTTFTVALPPSGAGALAPRGHEEVGPEGRPARLLVVDDEPLVATAVRRALSRRHEVVVATSGREALDLLRAGARFDRILCDVMMPGMTGIELHAALERVAPDQARVVTFMTGGAFTEGANAFLEQRAGDWLEKPLDLAKLRRIVDAHGAAAA